MEMLSRIDNNETISVLKKLVSIKSVNPDIESGEGEIEISNFIAEYLEKIGLEVHVQEVKDGRFNVIGILRGSGERKGLLFNGHVDTVGVRNMTIDPFKPIVENGKLYGRGSCDMKAAIAAMMVMLKALKESNLSPKGDLMISTVVGEEFDSVGANKLVEFHFSKTLGAVIVGEPTSLQLAIKHKGYINIVIETKGKAAHSSVPEKGIDAIEKMAKIITKLEEMKVTASSKSSDLLGTPKMNTSMIVGGREWSVVPDKCVLKVKVRTVPEYGTGDVMKDLQKIIRDLSSKDPNMKASTSISLEGEPLVTSPDEPIIKSLGQVFEKLKGSKLPIVGVPYWTEAPIFAKGFGAPTCVIGPGNINQAHTLGEYVLTREVVDATTIYALIAQKLLCT
jgi:acetylornithine deacetylase/succinyl-diaminopimelate desuccinylase family protein